MANVTLRTPKGRLSFPQLAEPKAMKEGQEKKYSCSLIFDLEAQKTPEYKALKARVAEIVKETWPKAVPKNLKLPYKKAEDCVTAEGERYSGCEDGYEVWRFQGKFQPEVLDMNKAQLTSKDDIEKKLYSGCHAMLMATPAVFNMPESKGVTVYLGNILKRGDDTPFAGRRAAKSDFADQAEVEEISEETADDGLDF